MPFDPRNNDPGGMGGYFVTMNGVSETPMVMPARDGYPTNSSSLGPTPTPPMPQLMGETTLGQQMGENGTLYDIRYNLLNGANSRGIEGGYQWIPAPAQAQVDARAQMMQDTYNQRTGANGGLQTAQQTAMDYQAGNQAGAIPAAPRFVMPPITASIGTAISPNIQPGSTNPSPSPAPISNSLLAAQQTAGAYGADNVYSTGYQPAGGGPIPGVVWGEFGAMNRSSQSGTTGPLTDRTGYWGDSFNGNAISDAGGAGVANPTLMRQAGMTQWEDGSFSPQRQAPMPQPIPQPVPQNLTQTQVPAQARPFPFNQGGPGMPPGFGSSNGPTVIPNPASMAQDIRNRVGQQMPPAQQAIRDRVQQQLPPVSRAQQLIDAQRKAMGR